MKHVVILFAILSLCINGAQAQDIRAVTENWPPYNFKDGDEITGISTEVVRATLERAGVSTEFDMYAWARAYELASTRENILIFTILRNAEREDLFKWVGPIVPYAEMALFRHSSRPDIVVESLEDAKQYKIGVAQDSSTHQKLLALGFEEGTNLFPVTKQQQNIEKLFKGRIDLITDREFSLAFQMKNLDLPNISFNEVEKVFAMSDWEQGFYMAFNKDTSDDLVERVRAAFEEIQTEGIVDAILEKYLSMYRE